MCHCPSTYYGTRCENGHGHHQGNLQVYARYGHDLRDRDFLGNSDPYLEVIGVDAIGRTTRKRTRQDKGDESPRWNQRLNFGRNAWRSIRVRVYDSDPGPDDALSDQQPYTLNFPTSRTNVRHECYGDGYVIFDYHYN